MVSLLHSTRGRGTLALALLLALPGRRGAAQAPGSWALKITPQHLVVSGLWLQAERVRPGHPGQSFALGPQFYAGPAGRPDVAYDPAQAAYYGDVLGAGLQAQHRFYLGQGGTFPAGWYVGYGPQVQFFRLSFRRDGWREEPGPGGVPYLVPTNNTPFRERVLRYGVQVQAGRQWLLTRRLLLDVYAGLGVRQSHSWSTYGPSQYQSGPSDYAHRGVYVPAGFSLGALLR